MEGQISYPSCFRERQMFDHSFSGGQMSAHFFQGEVNVLTLVLERGKCPGECSTL